MDPILEEFAKYGLAALVCGIAIFFQMKAIRFLFTKYDLAMQEQAKLALKMADVIAANTEAYKENTREVRAIGEALLQRNRGRG